MHPLEPPVPYSPEATMSRKIFRGLVTHCCQTARTTVIILHAQLFSKTLIQWDRVVYPPKSWGNALPQIGFDISFPLDNEWTL